MPAAASDLRFYKSLNGDSQGGTRSPIEIANAVDNNLFPDIQNADRVAGGSMTRKFFVRNEHGTDAFTLPVAWLQSIPAGITEQIGLGFDDADDDNADAGNLEAWSGNAALAAVSDGADARELTIFGVNSGGTPVAVSLSLNGTSEVVTPTVFSTVYAIKADAESTTRLVTIRQGSGGTIRGTIQPNRETSFRWVSPATKGTGIRLPNLAAGMSYGFWDRITWAAGISANFGADSVVRIENA